jgi:hypothetical protein
MPIEASKSLKPESCAFCGVTVRERDDYPGFVPDHLRTPDWYDPERVDVDRSGRACEASPTAFHETGVEFAVADGTGLVWGDAIRTLAECVQDQNGYDPIPGLKILWKPSWDDPESEFTELDPGIVVEAVEASAPAPDTCARCGGQAVCPDCVGV